MNQSKTISKCAPRRNPKAEKNHTTITAAPYTPTEQGSAAPSTGGGGGSAKAHSSEEYASTSQLALAHTSGKGDELF